LTKIKAVKPLFGRILDTSTGLGYTAIEAAKSANSVITVELDPMVLELCWYNPWSRELFDNPKIEQRIGDVYDEVERFSDGFFSHIIHDPPVMSLAGHLYSGEFYGELHRVLRPKGRLFHYIGDPGSKSGKSITRGVMNRLRQAGFKRVEPKPRAYGVVAYKSS
jgi:predicted methyltransferase